MTIMNSKWTKNGQKRVSSGPNMSLILDMIFIFKKIWGKIWQKIWDSRKIWRKIVSYFPSDFAYTIWYLSIFVILNFIFILIFLKYGKKYELSIWRKFVILSSYLDQMKRTKVIINNLWSTSQKKFVPHNAVICIHPSLLNSGLEMIKPQPTPPQKHTGQFLDISVRLW